jgi:type II restriction/modification system DNA methylase subunit YeeA
MALKQLLDLWKEVSTLAGQLGLTLFAPALAPSPAQLYGIELNAYAHELAQATVWIGYIQWLRDNGFGHPAEPILKPLHNIVQMDAILAYDENGQPVEPEWPAADVVIGNPPFLGDKKMRAEMGDKYVDDLRQMYEIPGQSDLVCYWFEKARGLIETNKLQRAGLLATQGIRGGANRTVLERIKETGDIFWAQSDRNWILDGATVHVSMVGFDKGDEIERCLNGKPVEKINADLSSQANLISAKSLAENQGLSFIGTQKNGPFDLTAEQAQQMLAVGGNPNEKSNSEVIKPWINALDVTQRPRNMWIIDFGVDMPLEEAAQYEKPFEYVRRNVKPLRDKVRRKNHREKWWLFGETRRGMRNAISNLSQYIATPMVSKHRIFAKVSVQVIPENLLVVIAREDDYFFGVLQSTIHELWSRAQGTQLREAESGQRYTPSTTFETFPFPWPPGQEPPESHLVQAIAQAAKELVEKRAAWLNPPGASEAELKKRTLTNLYNQRPTWLDLAHQKLDRAVLDAYNATDSEQAWPHGISDEQILAQLLNLNLRRAVKQ